MAEITRITRTSVRHDIVQWARYCFPIGSPAWRVYRTVRDTAEDLVLGSQREKAPQYVIQGNILIEESKAIYFYIPKVACSTLKKVCADALNIPLEGKDLAEKIHKTEFPAANRYKLRTDYANYYKFAFVRNPWDRLLSCYKDKICDAADRVYERHQNAFIDYLKERNLYREDLSFEEFVEMVCQIPDIDAEGHFRSQASMLSDRYGRLPLNRICRFESLAEDFDLVKADIGLKQSLPHLRKTAGARNYRDFYSSKMKDRVKDRYREDFTLYPYEF